MTIAVEMVEFAAILANQARPVTIECVGNTNNPNNGLSVVKNGIILSPRETKKYVISVYEDELGRKLSKKEGNLAMQKIRNALTTVPPDDKIVNDSHGNEILLTGPAMTWKEGTFSDNIERGESGC